MDLKDKLLIGAAVVCALIIFVLYGLNKANTDANVFVTGNYYTPSNTTTKGQKEGNSWSDFAKGNKLSCPGIGNTKPTGKLIAINGATKYKSIQYYPLTADALQGAKTVYTISTIKDLQLQDVATCTLGDSTGLTLIPYLSWDSVTRDVNGNVTGTGEVGNGYEIVAPFAFKFDSSNIDADRSTIAIVSTNRQLKIVFENVANWFCAGTPGTQTPYMNQGSDVMCDWCEHSNHHASIIGSSKNAAMNGGSAGDLIGYGDESTKMTLYTVENGQWVVKSWKGILKN